MQADSISITNHSTSPIQITTKRGGQLDINKSIQLMTEKYTIPPQDSFVFILEGIEMLHWEKVTKI